MSLQVRKISTRGRKGTTILGFYARPQLQGRANNKTENDSTRLRF